MASKTPTNDSDKMSSVSRCSNFSLKSQQYIAKQDCQMAKMKKAMIAAGLDPDLVLADSNAEVGMEVDASTKKRLPSGSPDGKLWGLSGSEDEDEDDDNENELNNSRKSKEEWMLERRGGKKSKMPTKREQKRLRRLEKVNSNKIEVEKRKAQTQILIQDRAQAQAQTQILTQGRAQAQAQMPTKLPTETVGKVHTSPSPAVSYSQIAASSSGLASGNGKDTIAQSVLPVFKTPAPDGAFKDEIIVDVLKMNDSDFAGTLTSTEIRKTIFEDVLGFKQDELAGVKVGFNRVRTITFKLKQQFDVDELFEWEHFDFERSVGKDVNLISCKIRGLRDPNKRKSTHVQERRPVPAPVQPYTDDGTRTVRIIGCDYRLMESEILDWLVLFGEVISEISEEIYVDKDDPNSESLPPIGNGTYVVKMKLKKDMPNIVPMYGRKVFLDYKGIRRQCNACFGPHVKKYCKNEKMSLDEFVTRFRVKHPEIPELYYGRLAKMEIVREQDTGSTKHDTEKRSSEKASETKKNVELPVVPKLSIRRISVSGVEEWVSSIQTNKKSNFQPECTKGATGVPEAPCAPDAQGASGAPNYDQMNVLPQSNTFKNTRVATEQAVNSMLNVIRATFKQSAAQTGSTIGFQEVTREQIPGLVNNSSASRGRGVKRS